MSHTIILEVSKEPATEGYAVGDRCPRCDSPQPHLHPAVQAGGEVQPCPHEYHAEPTPSNRLGLPDDLAAQTMTSRGALQPDGRKAYR